MGSVVVLVTGIALFAGAGCGGPAPPPGHLSPVAGEEEVLQVGQPRSGELAAGLGRRFRLPLEAGEAIALEIEQGVDLKVALVGGGAPVWEFDGPYGTAAPEKVCFVAPRAGTYQLHLEPWGRAGGAYRALWTRRRPATPQDRLCMEAAQRFMGLEARRLDGTLSPALAAEYEEVAAAFAAADETLLAGVAMRQAGIVLRRLTENVAAGERYERALVAIRRSGNARLEASLLNDLGQWLRDRRQFPAAVERFESALTLAEQLGDDRLRATALSSLALVDERQGRLHQAIDRLVEALELQAKVAQDQDYAQLQVQLAQIYGALGHHSRALALLAQAAETAERYGDGRRQATALGALGWTHYLGGQPELGIPYLRRALQLRKAQGDRLSQLGVLNRLGTVLAASRRLPEALASFEESLAISDAAGLAGDSASTTMSLACLYSRLDRPGEALAALAAARPQIMAAGDPRELSYLEYCQAQAQRRRGELPAALAAIDRAQSWVEVLHGVARQRGESFDPVWLWQDFAELQLHVQLDRARQTGDRGLEEQAFERIDLARSRRLFELVLEGKIGTRWRVPADLLDRERHLQQRLNEKADERRQILSLGSGSASPASASFPPASPGLGSPASASQASASLEAAENDLAALMLELERARAAIRAADPRYSEVVAPAPVRVAELRRRLPADTLLLRYVLTNESSYLFVLGREHWRVWQLDPAPVLAPQVQMFHQALRRSFSDSFQAQLCAAFLGRALLPEGALPAGIRRLLVVADDILNYVPFAALPATGAPAGSLLDDFEIQYLPSASLLTLAAEPRRTAPYSAAVFADPVFAGDDERFGGGAEAACGRPAQRDAGIERLPEGKLPRLPCTRREARHLEELVGPGRSLVAMDFAASKRAVLETPLEGYRILHFATHAFIDESFPELSGLVLSRLDAARRPIEGNLYLHEIYGLKLSADLVTLSGCQTALGKKVRGNGLLSMARGFLYGGCSKVLVSLWSVEDEATAELMKKFYDGVVSDGKTPAAALRDAQQWMRRQERWSAPFFWAAFVLQGSP